MDAEETKKAIETFIKNVDELKSKDSEAYIKLFEIAKEHIDAINRVLEDKV